jgi:hypothetical protein
MKVLQQTVCILRYDVSLIIISRNSRNLKVQYIGKLLFRTLDNIRIVPGVIGCAVGIK